MCHMSGNERNNFIDPQIIFEDESILIINKPSGWVVNNAKTVKNTPTIQTWVRETQDFEISNSDEYRSGIVHRLDKETSGVLILAKKKKAFENIQKQFKTRKVKKTYIALLHDKLVPGKGEINVPVGRLPWRKDRFGVLAGGRQSQTSYKVIKYLENNKNDVYSLTEFYPKTGRTHQIRIHSKHLHHPIVSDEFYAGRKRSRSDRQWCPRMFLHAYKINFLHPETRARVEYKAELHEDLQKSLEKLSVISGSDPV